MYCQFNIHSTFSRLTTYYALEYPHLAFDYDYAGDVFIFDGYVNSDYAFEGFAKEAVDVERYYNDGYVYSR